MAFPCNTHTRTHTYKHLECSGHTYKGEALTQLPGGRRNNKKKVKRKSVFTLFPWFQLQTKKLPKLACIHDTYEYTHTYTTCAWYVWYMAFEVRLGRAEACLRLFIATLFRAYKYYFRPSWSAHAMGRQLSGFMIWPQHTHKRIYIVYTYVYLPYAYLCYQ